MSNVAAPWNGSSREFMSNCAAVGARGLGGRGVAAAVMLRPGRRIEGIADSKTLSPDERAALSVVIRRDALCFGIGWADRAEIDALNILQATFLAMRRALLAMTLTPDHVLG